MEFFSTTTWAALWRMPKAIYSYEGNSRDEHSHRWKSGVGLQRLRLIEAFESSASGVFAGRYTKVFEPQLLWKEYAHRLHFKWTKECDIGRVHAVDSIFSGLKVVDLASFIAARRLQRALRF